MKPPRRHHYLPQFYLNYFTNDSGLLWEFDREENGYSQKSSYGTGWQKHYYSFQDKDGEMHYEIETELFKTIEDKTKPLIDKINKKGSLTPQDKEVLSTFIAFQRTRVPDFQKTMDESTEKLLKEMTRRRFHSVEATKKLIDGMGEKGIDSANEITPEKMFDFIKSDEYSVSSPREHSIKSMLDVGKMMIGYFMQMEWVLMHAPENTSFITSDNPCFILPPKSHDPDNFWERGVGLLTPGAKKLIALSSKVCLVMGDHGDSIMGLDIDRRKVRQINNAIATYSDKYVIGRDKTHLERIIKDTKVDTWMKTERVHMS